jgi:endoglucanase Acf2
MAAISNYLENALINAIFRDTAYTSPSDVYVGLFTSDPTDAGSGTEVSGGSYARVVATFGAPSNGSSASDADITFAQATALWGTVTHIGIFDALTSGNLLYHGALTASKTIDTGDVFKIPAGSLTVSLA